MTERLCTGCGLRLSIADAGRLCMFCAAAPQRPVQTPHNSPARFDAQGRKLCRRCGYQVVAYRGMCQPCAAADTRRRKARKAA